MGWLATSLLLSVVLTVVLNVALRAWPRSGERLDGWMRDVATPRPDSPRGPDDRVARVIVPWKAMLVGSLVLTVVLNLVLWVL
jgi:hypothetical protein